MGGAAGVPIIRFCAPLTLTRATAGCGLARPVTPAEGGSPRVTWGDEGTAGSLHLPQTAGLLSWFSAQAGNGHAAAALTADAARGGAGTTSVGRRGGGRGARCLAGDVRSRLPGLA
jgi:hypothetical protein